MPEIKVTNFELARVLAGHRLSFLADDGQTIAIRLFTTEELLADQAEALDKTFPDDPIQRRAMALDAQTAEHLTRPIKLVTA